MSTSGVMAQLRAATVPLQCPFCDAHGWVTLVTRSNLKDHTFRWRCTKGDHELVSIQPVSSATASLRGVTPAGLARLGL
jgi:hypothetical protein